MPSYVYGCSCGVVEEVLMSIHDDGERVCPACGAVMARKPSLGAVTFKGTGWGKDAR